MTKKETERLKKIIGLRLVRAAIVHEQQNLSDEQRAVGFEQLITIAFDMFSVSKEEVIKKLLNEPS